MWWALTKKIVSAVFMVAMMAKILSCQKSDVPVAKLYLASSLLPLAYDLQQWARNQHHQIDAIFLTSSTIAKQIEQGAYCDAAILADDQWSDFLIKKNLAIKKIETVAKNFLVIASNTYLAKITLSEWLNNIQPHEKIIIGDPDFVPLGRYTKEALESLFLYKRLFDHLMPVHSAHHASFLLKKQAAPYAILYYTDAINNDLTILASIDRSLHRQVKYPFLICNGTNPHNQNILMNFFMSLDFNHALTKWGFIPIIATTKSEML